LDALETPKGELNEWQENDIKEAIKWHFLSDLAIRLNSQRLLSICLLEYRKNTTVVSYYHKHIFTSVKFLDALNEWQENDIKEAIKWHFLSDLAIRLNSQR
jgi:hypothetical protein